VAPDMSNVVNWRTWKAESASRPFMTWMQESDAANAALINRHDSWADSHLVLWNLIRFGVSSRAAASSGTVEHFPGNPPYDLQLSAGQEFLAHDPDFFEPGGEFYPAMQAYFESLHQLKAAIEERHARLVLVWTPLKERVYVPLLPAARQAAYVSNRTHDLSGFERVIGRFAAQEGIDFFDLTIPLAEHARRGEKLYFTVDGHWNSHGHEVAGAAVASSIRMLAPHPPAPASVEPPLYFRKGAVAIARAVEPSTMAWHSAIVRPAATTWRVEGRAESQFSYLALWPEQAVTEPQWLVATGVIRRGGLSLGLQRDGKWLMQQVLPRGRFDVALPVTPGKYVVAVANASPADASLDAEAEFSSLGWAPLR